MARTPWTPEEVAQFIENHEASMERHDYPEEIRLELRRARNRWIQGVRVERPSHNT